MASYALLQLVPGQTPTRPQEAAQGHVWWPLLLDMFGEIRASIIRLHVQCIGGARIHRKVRRKSACIRQRPVGRDALAAGSWAAAATRPHLHQGVPAFPGAQLGVHQSPPLCSDIYTNRSFILHQLSIVSNPRHFTHAPRSLCTFPQLAHDKPI